MHASPKPEVSWYKDGQRLDELAGQPGYERVSVGHSGRKYLLVITDQVAEDRGRYTCHATNNIGEAKGNIQVMGEKWGKKGFFGGGIFEVFKRVPYWLCMALELSFWQSFPYVSSLHQR